MGDERIRWAVYASALGELLVASDAAGVARLSIGGSLDSLLKGMGRAAGAAQSQASFAGLFRALDEYFKGAPVSFAGLALSLKGSAFDMAVWNRLRRLPWGESLSYSGVAGDIGRPGAARAVGGACGRNPVPILVPCHRVLASGGRIGGFSGGLGVKRALLALEGIEYMEPREPQ